MKQVILIADFGSSNVRVHAIDTESGKIIAQHAVKYPILSPQPGYFEHDPEEMWSNSVECVRKVYEEIKGEAEVKAISFSHIGWSFRACSFAIHCLFCC